MLLVVFRVALAPVVVRFDAILHFVGLFLLAIVAPDSNQIENIRDQRGFDRVIQQTVTRERRR